MQKPEDIPLLLRFWRMQASDKLKKNHPYLIEKHKRPAKLPDVYVFIISIIKDISLTN